MDLDDEELKATRRMNGSDKNVACMEDDIKQLEDLILDRKSFVIGDKEHDEIYIKDIQALEHLIKAYKEEKQENRKLSKANETYIKSIQNITPVLMNDYIEKSLVEEKIEEINRKIKHEDNEKVIIWLHKQRKILQELLEKRK